MNKFKLEVTLGNDAMQSYRDIREALINVADLVSNVPGDGGSVRDANGNTVGSWKVTK